MAPLVAGGVAKTVEILVTGGGGLLGHHLVQALLDRGDRVRVLALPGEDMSWFDERGVEVHRGDICRRETLATPMDGADAVLHLAGMIGVWRPLEDYLAVNATGTENVCRAAVAQAVTRIVHVSSWTVYGMDQGEPCREDRPLAPFSEPYAISKAEGDRLVQRMIAEEGLPAVIIRPGTFFGPGDRLHFARIADRLRAGRSIIIGRGDNALPLVYVTDIVQGLLLGLDHENALGQAFNITNDAPLTQQEFLRAIAAEIGAKAPRLHVPYRALYAAGYAFERLSAITRSQRQPLLTRLGVNVFGTSNRHAIDKARKELGYVPQVSLHEGVRLTGSWYRTLDS
jgi:nucleoside-diphosphate-sugar epimerase